MPQFLRFFKELIGKSAPIVAFSTLYIGAEPFIEREKTTQMITQTPTLNLEKAMEKPRMGKEKVNYPRVISRILLPAPQHLHPIEWTRSKDMK